jgi:pimeloyl-ACP methyl ester carboxylesterase
MNARAKPPLAGRGGQRPIADDYGVGGGEWLSIDWRQHLRQVEVSGTEVNYVELGEGPPVVLIHGISGCWQNWLENIPDLARSHRVIAFDLPAFGASPSPPWTIDIPSYGRMTHELCAELGLGEGIALVGNSLGGFIALEAVTTRPDSYDRLVLVSTAGLINTWRPDERSAVVSAAWRQFGPLVADLAPQIVSLPVFAICSGSGSSATRPGSGPSCSGSRWSAASGAPASPKPSRPRSTTTSATASTRSRRRP